MANGVAPLEQLFLDVGLAHCCQQSRQHVFVRNHVVKDAARFDSARPTDNRGNPVSAFPVGVLFATEWRGAAVRSSERLGTVISRVHHDRIVGEAVGRVDVTDFV